MDMLGGLTANEFLRDYWQKKPLVIRQAFPGFQCPVSQDELAGLACEEAVESRIVIENDAGKPWQLHNGPFTPDRFSELPEQDWTLLVQGLDHWVPEIADLLDNFRFIPNWRLDDIMASYAPTGGSVGPHYDMYDVFLLQAQGHRRWTFGGHCDHRSPRVEGTPLRILSSWDGEETVTLAPGDMLYLPPGSGLPVRVHGAFVDDDEVHRVVSAWKARGEPVYVDDVLNGAEGESLPGVPNLSEGGGDSEGDALYDEAVAFVTEGRRVSISSVQRKFKIGYNRAANLVDAMEASGVVSAAGHNGAREVLAPPPPRD